MNLTLLEDNCLPMSIAIILYGIVGRMLYADLTSILDMMCTWSLDSP